MVPQPGIASSSDLRQLLYERSRDFRDIPPVCLGPRAGKWAAASGLQKSIRRGNAEIAAMCAETLLLVDAAYLWRRLPTITLEDVAFGNKLACAATLEASRSSMFRHRLGDRAVLHCLIDALTSSTKDRSLCDLLMLDNGKPPRAHDWYRHPDTLKLPFLDDYLARHGFACAGLGRQVPALLGMMPDRGTVVTNPPDEPGNVMIGDLPACTYDKHTSQGKRSISYFCKACPDARRFFAQHPDLDPGRAMGIIVFLEESAYLDRELSWPGRSELYQQAVHRDFQAYGLTNQQGKALQLIAQANRATLNECRRRIVGG